MNILSVEKLGFSYGALRLFEGLSFGLQKGQKVALVGRNGCGKSTLLSILAGHELPDEGKFSFNLQARVGFLDQNPDFGKATTIAEAIFDSNSPMMLALREYEELVLLPPDTDGYDSKLHKLTDKLTELGAWDVEHKVRKLLTVLGISDMERALQTLSGGQRKRVALARLMLDNPDVLILDEPTNHLDIDAVEYLEVLLSEPGKTVLFTTHDRYFLDQVADTILEIDHRQLFLYKGKYNYYLEKKAQQENVLSSEADKARNLLRREMEWLRRQPKARGTKSKARIDGVEVLKEKASWKTDDKGVELAFKAQYLGSKILELHSLSKKYDDLVLLENFTYIVKKQDRIGIVGRNGIGKSTLLQMITGQLLPDSGNIVRGDSLQIGYFNQDGLDFKDGQRVIEVVKSIAEVFEMEDGSKITASQFLQRFLFEPARQHDYVQNLSGGEKRRLQLLTVLAKKPNFLILDEPTNDLDLNTLNLMEAFLSNYPGVLVIVSHDRYFLDRLTDHLFVFSGNGHVRDFNGNYSDYREWKAEQEAHLHRELKERKAEERQKQEEPKAAVKVKMSFKEKHEFSQLEAEIQVLENEKNTLTSNLSSGETDHTLLENWSKRIEEVQSLLEDKELRWLELSEKLG